MNGTRLWAAPLQPWVGRVLDQGRGAGDLAGAWERGILLLAGAATVSAVMTLFVAGQRSAR